MARQEKDTFKKIFRILEDYAALSDSLFGEKEKRESELVTVAILKDVPTFVGTDMKEYGPFSEGQKVDLPTKIARMFISRKIAEEK